MRKRTDLNEIPVTPLHLVAFAAMVAVAALLARVVA